MKDFSTMRRHFITSIVLLFFAVQITACAPKVKQSNDEALMDYATLIDTLRATGVNVVPSGEIAQPFFSVKGRVISVNGKDVQVFEYANADEASAIGEHISPDGSWIGKHHVNWVAAPHFYQEGKLIILFLGPRSAVPNELQAIVGPQIAGG